MAIRDNNFQPTEYDDQFDQEKFQAPLPESSFTEELNRQLAKFRRMGREIGAFINGIEFNLDREHGEVKLNLRRKTRPLVELTPLLRHCGIVYPLQALIGWTGKQQPMFWVADQPRRHLLISGGPHSGKTGLLRSLILTLVLATRPSKLQLALIDGSCQRGNNYDHSELKRFSSLPHMLNRPPTNPEEVGEIIQFLATEADHRHKNQIATPQILLVIDNVEDVLPVAGPEFHQNLEHILDLGAQTGIAVILSTNRPEDGRLQDLISGIEIDRMVGKVHSAGQAHFATGVEDSDAEFLDGNGEFLAVINQQGFHFQAAWVSERQLKRYIRHLLEPKQPTLLAWNLFEEADEKDYLEDQEFTQDQESDEQQPKNQPQHIYTRIEPSWLAEDENDRLEIEREESEEFEEFEQYDEETDSLAETEEPLEEQEHQLGWKTVLPFALAEPEEEPESTDHELEEDPLKEIEFESEMDDDQPSDSKPVEETNWFDDEDDEEEEEEEDLLSAESLDQLARRSRLPKNKIAKRTSFKPIPKPSAEKSEIEEPVGKDPEQTKEASFDPWQNGLDDMVDTQDQQPQPPIDRPPKLAKPKSVDRKKRLN